MYTREQIIKENAAMGKEEIAGLEKAPWRLIAIKGQSISKECPMAPITMMRNELISQGGSGVPIDKDKYMESVKYWQNHATIR